MYCRNVYKLRAAQGEFCIISVYISPRNFSTPLCKQRFWGFLVYSLHYRRTLSKRFYNVLQNLLRLLCTPFLKLSTPFQKFCTAFLKLCAPKFVRTVPKIVHCIPELCTLFLKLYTPLLKLSTTIPKLCILFLTLFTLFLKLCRPFLKLCTYWVHRSCTQLLNGIYCCQDCVHHF